MTQSLTQQRAKHALERVEKHKEGDKKVWGEYVSYVSSLPYMILNNGLGQACAFFISKKGVHEVVYNDLQDWLTGEDNPCAPYADSTRLIDGITKGSRATYLLAQAEALAYLEWLKKFAKAFLETEGE